MIEIDHRLRRVVIGGAGGSLGVRLVRRFLEADRQVVALCRNDKEVDFLQQGVGDCGTGNRLRIHSMDLASGPDVRILASGIGSVQGVVNAAGAFSWAEIKDATDEDFSSLLAANLFTSWNLLKAFLPAMQAQDFGRMVFISSKATLGTGTPGIGPYLAAKAGINMLVQSAAEEVKEFDININAVLPSIIDNPQNRKDMPNVDPGRWVSPEGLSELICSLFSPAARHVNGALIPVAGRV